MEILVSPLHCTTEGRQRRRHSGVDTCVMGSPLQPSSQDVVGLDVKMREKPKMGGGPRHKGYRVHNLAGVRWRVCLRFRRLCSTENNWPGRKIRLQLQ